MSAHWQTIVVHVDYLTDDEPRIWRLEVKARTHDEAREKATKRWRQRTGDDPSLKRTCISTYTPDVEPR